MINLYIHERQVNGITVLDLKRRARIGGQAAALHNTFRTLVGEGKMRILLNLDGVTYMDSGALGELISGHISVHNKGGELKIAQLSDSLRELMSVVKVLTVFEVYDNEAEALLSFGPHVSRIEEAKVSFAGRM